MFDWFRYRPFDAGFLPEVDGYKIFYQQLGNPKGTPVLVFNGGPGYPNDPRRTRYLNLSKYRMIIFDQRGTGGSVHTSGDVLHDNTTDGILDDAKRLIEHLGIERKIVSAGTSWGATLAVLFAQKYPDMVGRIISMATFTASKQYSKDWFEKGARLFYPDIIAQLREQANGDEFTPHFNGLLSSHNPDDIRQAMLYFGEYEGMLGSKNPKFNLEKEFSEFEIKRLKIALHYDANEYFLTQNQILLNMDKVKEIPMLMLHNRMDFVCPVEQAWDIHKAHPNCQMHIYPALGHGEGTMGRFPKKIVKSFLGDF